LNAPTKRIIYVDMMRAFAVIMMIQGHTVDTFLAEEFHNANSLTYSVWHTLRGFTAPIFMFTAGLIFTYLLKSDKMKSIYSKKYIPLRLAYIRKVKNSISGIS